jgi:hypothetical protein
MSLFANPFIGSSIGGGGNTPEHNHDDRYYTIEQINTRQGKVKTNSTDSLDYLSNKIDNITLKIIDNELKVTSVDGLTIGASQISSWLSGTAENIQNQIDDIKASLLTIVTGIEFYTGIETKADLLSITDVRNGMFAVVISDESHDYARTLYAYSETYETWVFLGMFEFADEFIRLKDTPTSYTDSDGKYVKVDEVNKKLVFDDIDYNKIKNKPSSTPTQIDSAVNKMHEHNNIASLNKIDEIDGVLSYNGVKYTPLSDIEIIIPKKQYLSAWVSSNITVSRGNFII